ncbi:DUF4129 domain-containing protein [Roseateles chitosanitabidus]|uniref:DUF4129 domain-containing protein n=1 Tax=Roseateles chitosanitabidus TaxID=65048 RepID=UPI000A97F2BA|nr:DUF4129 domain-containing protein [Roseateles chitosanitabidus]
MRSGEAMSLIGRIARRVMTVAMLAGIASVSAQTAPAASAESAESAAPAASDLGVRFSVSPSRAWTSAIPASAVMAAASDVGADPLLPGTDKTRALRFKKHDEEKKDPADKVDAGWWRDFFQSLSAGLRIAMWLVVAGLFVFVLLRLRDWFQTRDRDSRPQVKAPTHVGSLDIRPESLPDDIGAAARALWQRGETRPALSLLYRGALSRLVHGHGVPIRAASTESDCLALASSRLRPDAQDFLARLVSGWQSVAYARRELAPEDFEWLCAGFNARMAPERRP